MAAESVTILKTEPGSYSALAARFIRVSGGLSFAALGLNVGQLATARSSPGVGILHDHRPALAWVSWMACASSFSAMY